MGGRSKRRPANRKNLINHKTMLTYRRDGERGIQIDMKRIKYKGYIVDTDDLGRPYIYYTQSPYSEDSDHILVGARNVKECKAIIDARIKYQEDIRSYFEVNE